MKVGILTFHNAINYGAALQATGLKRAIAELGHDVRVVDYRHPAASRAYRRVLLRSRSAPFNLLKAHRFSRFAAQHLALTRPPIRDRSALAETLAGFDAVVCGSDQVWDIRSMRGFAKEYFLDLAPDGARRIAYAPSFGATTDPGDAEEELRRLLSPFHAISARDRNTQDLVRRLAGRDATPVLDPTFLARFDDAAAGPTPAEPYLLLYATLPPDEHAAVRRAADALRLRLVSVGYRSPASHTARVSAGPAEFLSLYRGASCVVTSFFHGAIFAVLNRKPLAVISKPDKAIKVNDLFEKLGVEGRTVARAADARPEILREMDYGPIERRIAEWTEASRNYLREALS